MGVLNLGKRNVQDEIKKGKEALLYFHNASLKYSSYPLSSVDELAIQVSGSEKKAPIFLEGLGFAIYEAGSVQLSDSRVRGVMESLAYQGKGKVPDSMNAFFNALTGASVTINWIDATKVVATNVTKEVVDKVSSFSGYLPYIVGGALFLAVYTKVK